MSRYYSFKTFPILKRDEIDLISSFTVGSQKVLRIFKKNRVGIGDLFRINKPSISCCRTSRGVWNSM